MKKNIVIVSVIFMTAILTACGNSANGSTEPITREKVTMETTTETIESDTEITTSEVETFSDAEEMAVETAESNPNTIISNSKEVIVRIPEGTPVYEDTFEEEVVEVDGELPIKTGDETDILFYTANGETRVVTKEDFTINVFGHYDFLRIDYDGPSGVTTGYVKDYTVLYGVDDLNLR